jgi:OmpA-OmpF porin, OOP family
MSKTWVVAVALASGMGTALAQVYVEGGLGLATTTLPCDDFRGLGVGISCGEQQIGTKALVGYALSPQLAVEAGYIDFGRGSIEPEGVDIDAHFRLRSRTAYLGGRLALPLAELSPQLTGVLRAGLGQVKTRVKAGVDAEDLVLNARGEIRQVQPILGLGLQWTIQPRLSLVAGADLTWMASEGKPGRTLSLLSLGLNYTPEALSRLTSPSPQPLTARPVNYMMVQVGQVDSDALNSYRNDASGSYQTGNKPVALRLTVGRQFGPIWAMELGLTHYGEDTVETRAGVVPQGMGKVSPIGLSALSVWRMPIDDGFNWVTRLGMSYTRTKGYDLDDGSDTTTKLAPMYGLGLEYVVDKAWRVMATADATRIRVLDQSPMVKVFALGAGMRF